MKWKVAVAQLAFAFFAEMLTVEIRGEVKPFVLEPFQKFIVGSIFGWHNADDTRRFRTGYVEIGKGNGKSPLAAGIGLHGLVADNEISPEIYPVATAIDQAKIVFKDAALQVSRSDDLKGIIEERVGSLYFAGRNGVMRPLASDPKGLPGKRVHMALVDELHEHPTSDVVDQMRAGTKNRQNALIFEITNSGSDIETVCGKHHEYSLKVIDPEDPAYFNDPSWFAYVCSLDEKDEYTDERVWLKANPGLGTILPIQYLRERVLTAQGMPSQQNIVKRLNFCIWTQQVTIWLQIEDWDKCKGELVETDLKMLPAFGGLDLSTKLDLTAFVVTVKREDRPDLPTVVVEIQEEPGEGDPKDEPKVKKLNLNFCVDVHPYFWIPEATMHAREKEDRVPYSLWREQGFIRVTPGNVVDYDVIYREIVEEIAPRFNLRQIGYDPWNSTQFALNLQTAGFEMVEVRQGAQSMSEPSKVCEALILSGRLRHDGHPVLRWNISNIAAKEDKKGNIFPFKPTAKKRIDGGIGLIVGLSRLIVAPEEFRSVYETRGPLVFSS